MGLFGKKEEVPQEQPQVVAEAAEAAENTAAEVSEVKEVKEVKESKFGKLFKGSEAKSEEAAAAVETTEESLEQTVEDLPEAELPEEETADEPVVLRPEYTYISDGVKVTGDFVTTEQIDIYGDVTGSIDTTVDVFVAEQGSHSGKVKVRNLNLLGEMDSEVTCLGLASLGKQCKFSGVLATKDVEMTKGCKFDGVLRIGVNPDSGDNTSLTEDDIFGK